MGEQLTFRAEVWQWDARTEEGWYFVTLPVGPSEEIADRPRPPRGFGSVKVRVRVGGSTWSTSIFPDSKAGAYVLPLKKAVRKAEGIELGDEVEVELETVE
ncbi:DUF1905 domain-containing protein [Agromyces mangrovi Wang et al. 2018]|uniref:DUF1905 domain-containing protein n=1 Tax=Agromyces mangrovi TaxID=1858653 RepID=UPI002574408F|nr:DUF1905 domain-containing protein [Agromyces mangrovi]BDZ64278.1 hypothetical protein GCM10025877_12160 [Agromyces mangrovi]